MPVSHGYLRPSWPVRALACVSLMMFTSISVSQNIAFSDQAKSAGVFFEGGTYMASVADFDQDGNDDIAFSRHSTVALLHNTGEGKFKDLSESLAVPEGDFHGLSWVDLNDDGWLDLFVTQGAKRGQGGDGSLYYQNDSKGRLLPKALTARLKDEVGRGRGVFPWDLNRDGHLDIILSNAHSPDSRWVVVDGESNYEKDLASVLGVTEVTAGHLWAGYLDAADQPFLLTFGNKSEAPALWRIESSGPPMNVSKQMGLPDDLPIGISYVAVADLDNDGDQDLYYVANEVRRDQVRIIDGRLQLQFALRESTGRSRVLRFSAKGKLRFALRGSRALARSKIGLGNSGESIRKRAAVRVDDERLAERPEIDFEADYGVYLWRPAPGVIEMIVLGDLSNLYFLGGTVSSTRGDIELISAKGMPADTPLPCNQLYVNEGQRFIERSAAMGVRDCGPGQAASVIDVDNDGYSDLFLVNGDEAFGVADNVLLMNRGGARFEAIDSSAIRGPKAGRSGNAVTLDYNNDGRTDLFVTHGAGPMPAREQGTTQLLRNDSEGGHWLKVRLVPSQSNTLSMGARVKVTAGDLSLFQQRSPEPAMGPLHFGLGTATQAEVEVRWPSGNVSRVTGESNRLLTITEDAAATEPGSD